ncbi:MAG: BspA family leucine-rich repeat surface protein, partial [Bacilli bacterium]|nr:BspA family leucine-rich repeat surface protein [Bacilli bacterium]
TSNVTDMSYMFSSTGYSNPNFTLDLGDKFDTSNVTNMSFMISSTGYCSKVFTLDLGDKFDTSNVTNMSRMFLNTGLSNPNFTLDLSGFNTSNVTNMLLMFGNLSNLKTIYVGEEWTTDAVTSSSSMFKNCTSLPNFNSSVVDKTNAHYGEGGYLTLKNNT